MKPSRANLIKTLYEARRQIESDAVLLDRARVQYRTLDQLINQKAMPAAWYMLNQMIERMDK